MAKNRKYVQNNTTLPLTLALAQTAARTSNKPISGDPVQIGDIPGVALLDADSAGLTVVQTDGVFELLVGGVDSSGASSADANVTVKGGDSLYFDKAQTPPVSRRSVGGIFFGYALGNHGATLVASGILTTKIYVKVGR